MSFTDQKIQQVWGCGVVVADNDPRQWRKDGCGAWIYRPAYGNRNSQYGWEVDHIHPQGGDGITNLQPLQWQNNVAKSDGGLACTVTAVGTDNLQS